MIWFKGCPRCSGDMFHDSDQYGQFVTCAQCGFSKDVAGSSSDPMRFIVEPLPVPTVPQWEGGKRRRLSHGGRHFTRTLATAADRPSESTA